MRDPYFKLADASRILTGIGNQTYGRKPEDMWQAPLWVELQWAEREAGKAQKIIDEVMKELFK